MTPNNEPQRAIFAKTQSSSPLLFAKSRTLTATSALENYIEKQISIPKGIREQAGKSQNALRDFLVNQAKADESFPRVLKTEDSDFLVGSFARHTKPWPLNDIDIFIPLDGHGLIYHSAGISLPYDVVTDGVLDSNPLVGSDRWMDGSNVSSAKLIQEFKTLLQDHYSQTPVKDSDQAVNIQMTLGETEKEQGLGFDVVPCFSIKPHAEGQLPFYLIPDGNDNWIRTNPRLDILIAQELHENNDKTYRKVAKLVKHWNKYRFGSKLGSYYVELAIMRYFRTQNASGTFYKDLPRALVAGFDALVEAIAVGDQSSWLKDAPAVECAELSADEISKLKKAAAHVRMAYLFDLNGTTEDALQHYASVFGILFPNSK